MKKMKKDKLVKEAYCPCCEDLVPFNVEKKTVKETLRGKKVEFTFEFGFCKECGSEVPTDIYYNERRAKAKVMAYNALGGEQLRVD